jgi:hypothetical protein
MNLEFLPEAVEFAGAAVGYGVGLKLSKHASEKSLKEVGAVSSSYARLKPSEIVKEQPGRLKRSANAYRRIVNPLALTMALTVSALGGAVTTHDSVTSTPATLELVIDHSGLTVGIPSDSPPIPDALPEINKVQSAFITSDTINSHAFVGSDSGFSEVPIQQINSIAPGGQSGLENNKANGDPGAVLEAIQAAAASKNSYDSKNAAVVVITDGDELGTSATQVINESANNEHIPMYILNVMSPENTGTPTVDSFMAIANQTRGLYIDVNSSTNLSPIVSRIESSLGDGTEQSSDIAYVALLFAFFGVAGEASRQIYNRQKRGLIKRNLGGK